MSRPPRAAIVLRWVLVLPVAFVSQLGTYGLGVLTLEHSNELSTALALLFMEGVSGFAFVLAGTFVAPLHRGLVAFVLLSVFVMVALTQTISGPIGLLVAFVGAGIGVFCGARLEQAQESASSESERADMKQALRWALVLPVAFLAGFVGFQTPILLQDPAVRSGFIDVLIGFGVSGFLFVGVGAWTAPAHRQAVAIVLGLCLVALTGFDIQGAISTSDAGATVGLVVRMVGAAIAVFVVPHVLKDADAETTA